MEPLRARRRDSARLESVELARRIGRELRIARVALGISQARVAARIGLAQSTVSEAERGLPDQGLRSLSAIARSVGLRLSVRLYPSGVVRLRDTGQLGIAEVILRVAHPGWAPTLEHPIGMAPDLRAADLVLVSPAEVLHLEIERNLADLQAQLRSGLLKRDDLAHRYAQPVRFILALPDTVRLRRLVSAHALVIGAALPLSSRAVMAALRSGRPLSGDGLLWVRVRKAASPAQAIGRADE